MIGEYGLSSVAFIEWHSGIPQNRKDILKESGGGTYVPEAMIDSAHEFETGAGSDVYDVYRGMVNRSLSRDVTADITATYARTENTVTIKATITNNSAVTLSVQNKAAVQAIVYEDYRQSKTNHAGRGSAKTDISYLRPGRSETFMITVTLSGVVDYNNLHYIVLVDYKTAAKDTGVYDQLQAAIAVPGDVTPPLAFNASPTSLSFDIKTGDTTMPTGQISLTGGAGQNWTATADKDFVQISPSSGSVPGTLTVTIDKTKLVIGTQTALILFSDTVGLYERAVLVTVKFSLSNFNVTPTTVTFNFSPGDPTPYTSILPKGDAGQTWTATANKDWVVMTPVTGNINVSFKLSVDPSKLSPGYQEALITVSDGGGYQSKQVKLKVTYHVEVQNFIFLPLTLR